MSVKATRMDEGGVVVSGTDNPRAAMTAALREYLSDDSEGYSLAEALKGDPDNWIPEALWRARWLRDTKPQTGRMRWTPCSPRSCWDGGGHRGHLQTDASDRRGSWLGVWWQP